MPCSELRVGTCMAQNTMVMQLYHRCDKIKEWLSSGCGRCWKVIGVTYSWSTLTVNAKIAWDSNTDTTIQHRNYYRTMSHLWITRLNKWRRGFFIICSGVSSLVVVCYSQNGLIVIFSLPINCHAPCISSAFICNRLRPVGLNHYLRHHFLVSLGRFQLTISMKIGAYLSWFHSWR